MIQSQQIMCIYRGIWFKHRVFAGYTICRQIRFQALIKKLNSKIIHCVPLNMYAAWGWLNIKMSSYKYIGNPIMEIRLSYDRLISTMGFLILVRWYLYIESVPWMLRLDSSIIHSYWVGVIYYPNSSRLLQWGWDNWSMGKICSTI